MMTSFKSFKKLQERNKRLLDEGIAIQYIKEHSSSISLSFNEYTMHKKDYYFIHENIKLPFVLNKKKVVFTRRPFW